MTVASDTIEPAISVRHLRVVRGGKVVLPELSLDVARGSVVGMLGPSGSGKTTLMRAIVGVQRVESGDIVVLGQPAGDPAVRSRVAYMTQAASVYSDLSVEENLRYFAGLQGSTAATIDRTIDVVGLGDDAGRIVGTLSGGQRSRVSLAAALVGEPEVLVLDEPTVGLDPVLRRDLWATFRALAGDGVTLLVSSHVMDEADECDSVVLLREGRVVARDSPLGLRNATDADDLNLAFLRLIERDEAGE